MSAAPAGPPPLTPDQAWAAAAAHPALRGVGVSRRSTGKPRPPAHLLIPSDAGLAIWCSGGGGVSRGGASRARRCAACAQMATELAGGTPPAKLGLAG